MQVYIEVAFLENFLLDGVLLYLALACARLKISAWRLLLASALGAVEAIVFPLFPLPAWAAYLVKFMGGALLAVIAAKGRPKQICIATAFFFLFTFALGGLLTAVYSFFGIQYEAGTGYLVEQAPAGLVAGVSSVRLSPCTAIADSSGSFCPARSGWGTGRCIGRDMPTAGTISFSGEFPSA